MQNRGRDTPINSLNDQETHSQFVSSPKNKSLYEQWILSEGIMSESIKKANRGSNSLAPSSHNWTQIKTSLCLIA